MGNSGIATPFWYEWEVGLCKCLEMLYNENIESVVFQAAEFQSIDDVVVNYRDSSSLNIQVKHTDISANFTYSFLESDDLLKTWAQDWIKTRAKYNIRKIQIVTNKRWGSNKNRCEQKCSFEHFVTVVFPELQKDYEYNVASIFDANAIAWYKKQLDGIEYEDAAVFTKLLSFQQAPELCELEDAIHLELKIILGTDREDAINASQCSLFAHLAKWTTSQRKDEKVFPEDVYEALCVTENIPQKELYPEKPIFPSRIDFARKFVDSVKNSNKRLIVLEGLPGAGKTNFVSYLDQSKDSIVDFRFYTYLPHSSNMHYFSDDAGFYSSELLWSSILVQLRNKFSEMKLLHALSFPLRYGLMTVQEKRATALKYLSLFAKYSRKTCYFFIDGLDHAARCSDYLPSFIPQLPMPDEIPDGVKFVLVGQPINELYPTWMSRKNDQIEFYVMPLLEPQDVKMLISCHSISIPNIDISALADSIIKVVGNNTLNILFAIQEVSQLPKSETFDDIIVKLTEKQLSGHISNYYEWIFNSINIASDNKIAIEKMLMIFAFATQEISAEQISQLTDLDIFETTHYLNTLFPLIRSNNGLFYALHNDVRLYLKQKMLANSDFSALAMCFNKRIEANSDLEILKYSLLFSVLEESSDTQWIVQLFNCEYILNSIKYKIPIPTLLQQFQSVVRAIRDSKNMEYISALSLSSTMLSQYINCAEYYEKNFLLHSDLKYGKKTEAEKYIFDPQIEREAIVRDIYNLLSHDQVDRGKSLYNEYFGTFTITDFLQHCSEHETAECEGNTIQQETSKYIEQIGYICRYCNPVILCSHNSITENECLMFSTGWLEASKAFINEDEIRISLSVKCFYQYDLYLYIRELIGMSCIRAEHFSVLNDFFLQMKEVPLKDGFVSVPKGCYIQLEKKAAKYILDNIRASYGNSAGLVARIATFTEDSGLDLTLADFLDYYHLDPRTIYKYAPFSRLCARADMIEDFSESIEDTMTKAFARLAVIDSRRWIAFLLDVLPRLDDVDFDQLPDTEKRMLQMFYVTVWGKVAEDWNSDEVLDNLYDLADSPVMLSELIELLRYQYDRIDFIDEPVDLGFNCPLDLHCTYTRDQLLVAIDFLKPATVREGVKWLPEKQSDVFFVTLNKSDKDYSPTTMYNDYSINESLFHWQSQSTTAENSPTGQRYIHHREHGSKVLLFVREFKTDRVSGGAEAYSYLGTANYVGHDGSRPMNITWRLDKPIPAKYLKKTNKLMIG